MKSTAFLAASLSAGCIETNLQPPPPEWPLSQPVPVPEVTQTDTIVQTQTPQVDILWMVDNSCSMSDDQTRLTTNFPFFMDYFVGSGLDYHVGVTSSDIIQTAPNGADGKLVVQRGLKFIDADTPDPVLLFQEMATLGVRGAFPEKGLGATFKCLEEKRDTVNAGFYRDDAAIHTIIISDEPDYTQESLITQPEYVGWYQGLKSETDLRTFSSIVDPRVGGRYKNTTVAVGGINWDIHTEDWAGVLERLGLQAAGLKREYFLSQVPIDGTIEVTVEEGGGIARDFFEAVPDPVTGELVGDWVWNESRNSITFQTYVPGALAKVVIHYTRLASQQGEG